MTIQDLRDAGKDTNFIFNWYQSGQQGHFAQSLMGAITRADEDNQAKLARVFPEEVTLYRQYAYGEAK